MKNMTPILLPDGLFPYQEVFERFSRAAAEIDPVLAELVIEKPKEFSG